jgi:oligopeptide transport system substrate-binding protein
LQAQWRRELGIVVDWATLEFGEFMQVTQTDPPPIFPGGWQAEYPDPDNHLRIGFSQEQAGWQNETYRRLVQEARTLTDQKRRMALYHQAERLLVEEAVMMPLYYARPQSLQKPWVIGEGNYKDVIIRPH